MQRTLTACEAGVSDFFAACGEAQRRADKYGTEFGVFFSIESGYLVGLANNPQDVHIRVAVRKPGGCMRVPVGVRLWDEVKHNGMSCM